nr:hypothetical protein CFP56_40776 [Quercus suber]
MAFAFGCCIKQYIDQGESELQCTGKWLGAIIHFSLLVQSGAHCCVQGKLVLAPLMEFETSTTKNLFVWMEATVSSLNRLVKLSINEELVTKALSFHMPCKSKFSKAMRTYIFLAAIEVKINCRKRIPEVLNFPPLPTSGYIDENAYVLGSYEFYSAFREQLFWINRVANRDDGSTKHTTHLITSFSARGMSAIIWTSSSP